MPIRALSIQGGIAMKRLLILGLVVEPAVLWGRRKKNSVHPARRGDLQDRSSSSSIRRTKRWRRCKSMLQQAVDASTASPRG